MKSSMLYELLARLHGWYTAGFALVTLLMLLWKRSVLPYPPVNLASEVALLALLMLVELSRLLLARRGNLTLNALALALSLALTAPAALAVCYFLLWQTYVLRMEVVLCVTQLTFMAVESCCAVVCMAHFARE